MAKKKSEGNTPSTPGTPPQRVNKRGDRRGYPSNFPNYALKKLDQDDTKRDVIYKSLGNILAMADFYRRPPQNDDEVAERLDYFFRTCYETKQLPTVEKLCLSLNYSTRMVNEILDGSRHAPGVITDEGINMIRQAKEIIRSLDAELALDSKIQPTVYIFRAKNYYGMKDQATIEVTQENPLGNLQDKEQLIKKIEDSTTIDV